MQLDELWNAVRDAEAEKNKNIHLKVYSRPCEYKPWLIEVLSPRINTYGRRDGPTVWGKVLKKKNKHTLASVNIKRLKAWLFNTPPHIIHMAVEYIDLVTGTSNAEV